LVVIGARAFYPGHFHVCQKPEFCFSMIFNRWDWTILNNYGQLLKLYSNIRRTSMTLVSHIDQLKQKHIELEGKIEEAMRHPSTTDDQIAELKRQKLQLKDKINQLKS